MTTSDAILGGTTIGFSVACEGEAAVREIGATVSESVLGKTVVVLKQSSTVLVGSNAEAKTALHVATPVTADIRVCIEVDGTAIAGGVDGEASAEACAGAGV